MPVRPDHPGIGLIVGTTSTRLRFRTSTGKVGGVTYPEHEARVTLARVPFLPAAHAAFSAAELTERIEHYARRAAQHLPLFAKGT